MSYYEDNTDWGGVIGSFFGFIVIAVVAWWFVAFIAFIFASTQYHATYPAEYAKSIFHISQGKPYPLTVGGTITGDVGSINGSFSFFLFGGSGSISGNIEPGQAVKLGIARGGSDYIATFPYNDVQFVVESGQPSTAEFSFSESSLDDVGRNFRCFHSVLPWACTSGSYQPLSQDQNGTYASIVHDNLALFLSKYVVNVRLIVTPAEYKDYLYG